eukprot:11198720-Lingulodinium_polyedra.AAC.1
MSALTETCSCDKPAFAMLVGVIAPPGHRSCTLAGRSSSHTLLHACVDSHKQLPLHHVTKQLNMPPRVPRVNVDSSLAHFWITWHGDRTRLMIPAEWQSA